MNLTKNTAFICRTKLHHKFSSFENFVFFCYHRTLFFFSKLYSYFTYKKVYVRLTVYPSLVSCACGTLCSGRRRRHLAVARRTTGLLLLHPKIGVLLLETSSTLSTFTFSKSRQTADSLSNKV